MREIGFGTWYCPCFLVLVFWFLYLVLVIWFLLFGSCILVLGALFTITTPVRIEVNNSYYHHTPFGRGKNNAHLLPIAGCAFECIFGIGPAGRFAFAVIDTAVGQNFFHFSLVYMPAVHTAPRMFGINKFTWVAVNNIVAGTGTALIGGAGTLVANRVIGIFPGVAVTVIRLFPLVLLIVLLAAFLPAGIILTGR